MSDATARAHSKKLEVPQAPALAAKLLHVAWLSIAVGILLELLLLGCVALFGKSVEAKDFFANAAQKITWSYFVCTGIALGTAASRALPLATGIAGFLAAPVAFAIARATHKSVAQALSSSVTAGASPILLAALKAAQYAVFGALIGHASGRSPIKASRYALIGAAIGVVFGGLLVWVGARAAESTGQPLATPALVSRAINEVLFPIGCALVIYAADVLGRRNVAESNEEERRA